MMREHLGYPTWRLHSDCSGVSLRTWIRLRKREASKQISIKQMLVVYLAIKQGEDLRAV